MLDFLYDLEGLERIGLLGAAIFVGTYFLTAMDRIGSQSPVYYALNFIGIGMAFCSHLVSLNVASAAIQAFILAISVLGLCRHRVHVAVVRPRSKEKTSDQAA